jgi:DNA-binding transcriptional LysR family regulator
MRRLPPFPALRAFEAAARLGSFAGAGSELHQTPSAISHQVRALEAWFERPLFVRSVRRVTLTAEGDRLLGELSAALDQIEDVCTALRPAAARSSLSVHCAPSFASKWLSPRLSRFMQAHPEITIRLSSDAESVDLRSHADIDIDITYGPPPARAGVVMESLGSEPTLPLAAPHLFNSSLPGRPRDLLRFTLIDSKLNPVQWADWCKLNSLKLPPSARPSFDRGSLAVAAAADGLGIALETRRFAEAELARGDLIALDGPAFRRIERDTHFLCYRKTNEERATIVVFKRWLTSELGSVPN